MSAAISSSVVTYWQSKTPYLDCVDMDLPSVDRALYEASDTGEVQLSDYVKWVEKIGMSTSSGHCWTTGLNYDFLSRGDIGQAILGSRTLGAALKRLTEFFPLVQDGSTLELAIEPEWTSLSYKILDTKIWPRHHDALYSLGVYAALIKKAAPDVWYNVDMVFEAPAHVFSDDLSYIVNASCRFEGDQNALFFPTSILDRPLALLPPISNQTLKALQRKVTEKRKSTPFHIQTRNIIMKQIEAGRVQQEDIASELYMTTRTLRRKLTSEGYSFQDILDECRMQIVNLEFKTRKSISLSNLALKLGYSEHSTFSRAFSRWTGLAPQDYRKKMQCQAYA